MKTRYSSSLWTRLVTSLFLILGQPGFSQVLITDSLKTVLNQHLKKDSTRAILLNQLSHAYLHLRMPEVKLYADEALDLSQKIKFPGGEAESYRLLGLTYLIEKPNAQALQYFAFSLAYFQKSRNHYMEIKALHNIARYYLIQKDYEQVASYLEESMNLATSLKVKELESAGHILYADLYTTQKEYKKAIHEINLAQSFAQGLRNEALFSGLSIQRVHYMLALEQFSNCIPVLENCVVTFKRDQNVLDLFYATELLGQVYLEENQFDKAHVYFDECLSLSHKYGSTNLLSRTLKNQSKLDSLKGDFKQSLRHYALFMKLKDSLNRSESDRQAVLFESRFAEERKSKENQILILQQSQNKVIIQQQFLGLFILFLALIGLVIILVKLQRLNTQNKQSLEEVLVKNQEIVFKNKIIEEQRLKQEKINVVKDKLFSVISHDMRTPLTQLQGILGLMEVNALKMSEWAELLPELKRNVQTSTEQLDTLLLWSKNQMQGFQPHITQFQVYSLAEKNLSLLGNPMEEKEIRYKNTIDPNLMVEADLEMIQIVIRNLLTNAIKFTQQHGIIELSSGMDNQMAWIKIKDSGVGIKPEDYNKVFEEIDFTTLGTMGEKGTGLGLKLCKDFITMNGGEIRVESIINQGSQFIFTIPLAKVKKFKFSKEVK